MLSSLNEKVSLISQALKTNKKLPCRMTEQEELANREREVNLAPELLYFGGYKF